LRWAPERLHWAHVEVTERQATGWPLELGDLARRMPSKISGFLAESLSLLLADLLRSVLSDASPALPADERGGALPQLADSLADGESRRRTSLGITRAGSPSAASPG
jgi:hypothetical protein